jgi:hypothetical protein
MVLKSPGDRLYFAAVDFGIGVGQIYFGVDW